MTTPSLGVVGSLRARIYTPVETVTQVDEILVRVVSTERLLWAGRIETTFPGHVLEIELDDILPRMVEELAQEGGPMIAELLANAVARHVFADFGRATRRALEGLSIEDVAPNTGAAHLIMAAVAREAMLRVRTDADGVVGLRPSLLSTYPVDLFDLPVLETVHGAPRTLGQVVADMQTCHGLIYGVIPEVSPSLQGLDTTPVLRLSTQEELLLMSIFGPSTYVRLDSRDILATYEEPTCLVRDLAVGLKEYPDFALLIEFASPHKWSEEQRAAIERTLVFKLLNLAYGSSEVEPIPENRRQALRHLQWFLLNREPGAPTYGLEDIPLFVDSAGRGCTYAQMVKTLEANGALLMSDGRGVDVIALGGLDDDGDQPPEGVMEGLAMDPFVLALLLRSHHKIHGAFDFDLSAEEARSAEHTPDLPYLVSREIHDEFFEGTIGVPLAILEDYSIAIIDPKGHLIHPARGIAYTYGMVGRLKRRNLDVGDSKLMAHVPMIMREVIDTLPTYTYDSPQWRAAIHTLLRHAGQGISLTLNPDRQVRARVYQPMIRQILELPLFDTQANFPVSAMRLLREFCLRVDPESLHPFRDFSTPLVTDLHPVLSAWLERHLHPRAITRHGTDRDAPATLHSRSSQADPRELDLERTLSHWLEALRPDHAPLHLVRGVDPERPGGDEYDTWWAKHGPKDRPFAFLVDQQRHTLLFHTKHPMITETHDRLTHDPEALAWLLLASYALINEVLEPVTNDHELTFQLAVSEALARGELRPV